MIVPRIIVKKEFLLVMLLLSAIYIALEFYYKYFISTEYVYMGYIPDLNLFKYAITKVVFISLVFLSHGIYKRDKFLFSIYSLLIFFFYIPIAILFSLSDFSVGPFVSTFFFVSCFALTPYIRFPIPSFDISEKLKTAVLLLLCVVLFVPIAVNFGLSINFKTLALSEIYETRERFSNNLNSLLDYFYHIVAKTIIPASLVFFFIHKKYLFTSLLVLMLLYLYVISGNKTVYFTVMIVFFFYYVGKNYVSKLSNFFLLILILFTSFFILDNFILDTSVFTGIFVNRFFFIPALLTNFYFDFFDGKPFYFAESHFFNHFIHSPYDMPVGFLITKEYWGEPTAYANNGIVSDGFMNLGYLGVLIFSIAFSVLFAFFNSLRLQKGYFGLYYSYLFLIISVPFFSSLITGGILIFIALSIFVLKENSQKKITV